MAEAPTARLESSLSPAGLELPRLQLAAARILKQQLVSRLSSLSLSLSLEQLQLAAARIVKQQQLVGSLDSLYPSRFHSVSLLQRDCKQKPGDQVLKHETR